MKLIFALTSILLVSCSSISKSDQPPMKTVQYVDLNRYLGNWYEIASYPQWFQKDCFCTRANYSLRDDGKINVYNTCNKGSVSGKLDEANGYAKIVDKESNAKLKVTFFWPFFGDYWIIGLDKDYRYVVISSPDLTTLWILSRTPHLADDLFEEAKQIAVSQGLDLSKLQTNDPNGCSYPN